MDVHWKPMTPLTEAREGDAFSFTLGYTFTCEPQVYGYCEQDEMEKKANDGLQTDGGYSQVPCKEHRLLGSRPCSQPSPPQQSLSHGQVSVPPAPALQCICNRESMLCMV